jgi:3',5'-cyclic-nucleotide phosphodiesterase
MFDAVFVCSSGRSFSTKLGELHDSVKLDCTPIIALFDVGTETRNDHNIRQRPRFATPVDSPAPSPQVLRRQITFSSESDESYGLQLLSRIASDLQVEDGVKLIIPVAIVQPKRKGSESPSERSAPGSMVARGSESTISITEDQSAIIDPQMMLNCLEAGALDVVQSPLDKAGILGLTVHAYRIYKAAKKEQAGFLARARGRRKQSWVGVEEEEKPYAYMREAMVKKLLKSICEPETVIEDYQHRELHVEEARKPIISREVGTWGFCAHDFSEDELVYAGYCMLNHALQMPELEKWRMSKGEIVLAATCPSTTANGSV